MFMVPAVSPDEGALEGGRSPDYPDKVDVLPILRQQLVLMFYKRTQSSLVISIGTNSALGKRLK
jgi:hypothetical protein